MASNRSNTGSDQQGGTGTDRPRNDQGEFESTRGAGASRSGDSRGHSDQPRNDQGEFESTRGSGGSGASGSAQSRGNPGQPRNDQGEFESTRDSSARSGSGHQSSTSHGSGQQDRSSGQGNKGGGSNR
jgi:hypothetical protein